MKIGIFTFAKGDNYGAVLQSYALGEWLRRKGHKVEYLYLTWTTLRYRITSNLTPLKRNFEEFRKRFLRDFSKECHSKQDLGEAVKGNDLVIVGSDQVWNPNITTFRALFYFFNFVPSDIKKVAYAASFGKANWEWPELTDDVRELLQKFESISVREEEGVKICAENFGVKAQVVLDPTFLLPDYNDLLTTPKYPNHIVGFLFRPSNSYYDLLNTLGKIRDKRVMVMDLPSRRTSLKVLSFSLSPFSKVTNWVTNIANADFVVTDSFHCMAFSIIFKRQFIFIATKKGLMSRITSLLKRLEIKDRIFDNPEEAIQALSSLKPINYDEVEIKLSEARKESEEFLMNAIKSVGDV